MYRQSKTRVWSISTQSFWFVPTLIVVISALLALLLLYFDSQIEPKTLPQWLVIGSIGADTALAMLSTIAGSMITAGTTVFSITIVALTLASMQFSPRVIGNFMHDRTTQIVLGVFLGVFVYCLLVLRAIRSGDNGFVPALSLLLALLLAFVGIGYLIYFVYRISVSIQASNIAFNIVKETFVVIDEYFPEDSAQAANINEEQKLALAVKQFTWQGIPSFKFGYLQRIDEDALLRMACQRNITIRVDHIAGSFIVERESIASVAMGGKPDKALIEHINRAFVLGPYRTVEHDIAFGIWELVDMALKALSAAVNDTSTGVMCVNHLAAIMVRIAQRNSISRYRLDQGELRLVTVVPSFENLLDQAYDQIRHNAVDSIAIIIRVAHSLNTIAGMTSDPQRRRAIMKQMRLISEVAELTVRSPSERDQAMSYIARIHSAWADEWVQYQLSSTKEEHRLHQ
jgi:uncharacterized membrane protein